jgi:hypothetical protein
MGISAASGGTYQTALEESKRLWRLQGEELDQVDVGIAAIERLGVVECFLNEREQMQEALGEVGRLAERWDVTVVVPTRRLGDAHEHFRGLMRVRLQGWWMDSANRVCFGTPEIP